MGCPCLRTRSAANTRTDMPACAESRGADLSSERRHTRAKRGAGIRMHRTSRRSTLHRRAASRAVPLRCTADGVETGCPMSPTRTRPPRMNSSAAVSASRSCRVLQNCAQPATRACRGGRAKDRRDGRGARADTHFPREARRSVHVSWMCTALNPPSPPRHIRRLVAPEHGRGNCGRCDHDPRSRHSTKAEAETTGRG